jgi:hypothetical protein
VVADREGGFQKKLAAVTVRLAALGSFPLATLGVRMTIFGGTAWMSRMELTS